MWEHCTILNTHNYILSAGMDPGPASLENKQEKPSSDQTSYHADTLL